MKEKRFGAREQPGMQCKPPKEPAHGVRGQSKGGMKKEPRFGARGQHKASSTKSGRPSARG